MIKLLKWLFKVPKKIILMLSLMNLFGIFASLIISYSAILSKDVINYAISKDKNFFISSFLLIAAVLTSHILLVFGKSFVSFVKGRYLKYLGEYCYKKIMLKDFLDFSKNTPAFYSEVTLRTTENMLNIIADYDNTGGLVFAFKILFYMITIYTLDKTSGILMVLFSILILISLGIANKFYYKRSKIVQDEFLDIKAYVSDMFKGMEEIKLFEAQNFEMELFENKVTPTWKKKNYLYSIDYILSFLTRDLISMIFYLLIIYRGIKSANAGTFFALINLFTLIRYQLFTSIGLWDNIRVGIISARQLEEFVG